MSKLADPPPNSSGPPPQLKNECSLKLTNISLFSDQGKLIDMEEAAKAAEKGKWAKDASEVCIL